MNIYLPVILAILLGDYILNLIVEFLNVRALKSELPQEFGGIYDPDKYRKAQTYLKDNTYFKLIQGTVVILAHLFLILSGGFNFIDKLARGFNLGLIPTGLIFAGILFFLFQIIEIPASFYHTFVIEEKYGFNKMRPKTFILDTLKSWLLTFIIGGVLISLVIWFFVKTGEFAWIFCWLGITLFELFLLFIAPVIILPFFNKFTPLEEGELKEAVENYARAQNFKLSEGSASGGKGLFKMDGSRRSAKSNAFFTGFGKYRRIVLFDTLINKHSVDELVSILAHEVGHYKKKHILKMMGISIAANGLMFFILSFFINNPGLFAAFRMEHISIYASLLFFGFLYAPINMIFSLWLNFLSRRHEYEADEYAVSTYKKSDDFILALKKLSADNLSNLTPHRLKVFISYSHPPVLERIKALRRRLTR